MPILELNDVAKHFSVRRGQLVRAVDGVSFRLAQGAAVSLIGESGSGKSTIGRLALRLLDPTSGEVRFEGADLGSVGHRELRQLRKRMQIVFQEPFESLNPRMRIGAIVQEPLDIHAADMPSAERLNRVEETLETVGLDGSFIGRRPADLSGGQQQRVGIARAIVTDPSLLVLDEPTSSLDLSVQAQVLELLARLRQQLGMSYLHISHDIDTVRYLSSHVHVMYMGRIMESGPADVVLDNPRHPYTQALLSASLSVDPSEANSSVPLAGERPSTTSYIQGCPLYGRCPIGTPECVAEPVPLRPVGNKHAVACIKAHDTDSVGAG